ncbi:hypothetical protein ABB37_00395 [Leptomonas pyrrhocoris]|uniref:Uncharacterized protein n=1 Tax=Leptomonas pyrrhocoris TaxID=157538 RepID=A0A0M9GAM5_LEPPY|nr:hypothetical protein ABB37_00395 [Leptomonas pyrrhocoris]XP_015664585.1 hypothetical protein ABB37_00395 [Leptomonas pyrrhocoris]KPA86145.1 hypothetical protein ABB37_00395 [Leptomonas pyrrhocoris]KPA86146.1 hypothetical protein ABB37_00395 [Leptomonas pyrrhocoris]|eukprot:XP_015664584.1 hypothetical protein ABB37_00395 [Leptomonas pyrrhocoris]
MSSSSNSLLHGTVTWLCASAYEQKSALASGQGTSSLLASTAVGYIIASPTFPFDVLTGSGAFANTTVLVVDVDSVVRDCVRVMRWCVSQLSSDGTTRQSHAYCAESAVVWTAPASVPSLEQLFCCFLDKLRDLVEKHKMQVELVLGSCEDALAELCHITLAAPVAGGSTVADLVGVHSAATTLREEAAADSQGHGDAQHSAFAAAPTTTSTSLVDATANLQGMDTDADLSISAVEKCAVWLQVYQVLVLFFRNSGRSKNGTTSLYCTAKPGWTGAVARVNLLHDTPQARNQQMFPLLWSNDPRAFFAAAGIDAVVSTWLSLCSREVEQLCGRALPEFLCLPREGFLLQKALSAVAAANASQPGAEKELTGLLLVRHGPSTAGRLGLRSAAYLPTFYALLALYDSRLGKSATWCVDEKAHHESSPAQESCSSVAPYGKASTAAPPVDFRVSRAAALVNQFCGVLHCDLVAQWMVEAASWEATSVPTHLDSGVASMEALDLATSLWAAQNALAEVTARDVSVERHLWTAWVGDEWVHRGPPPSTCPVKCSAVLPVAKAAVPPSVGLESHPLPLSVSRRCQQAVYERLSPLREVLFNVMARLFEGGPVGKDSGGGELGWERRVDAALGRKVYVSAILAETFVGKSVTNDAVQLCPSFAEGEAASVRPAEINQRHSGSAPDNTFSSAASPFAVTPSPAYPLTFQTRVSLDEVREHVRPAAQLTFVALSLMWCGRLWSEEDCLRFFTFYLQYVDAEARVRVGGTSRTATRRISDDKSGLCADQVGIAGARTSANPASNCPIGVRESEVAAWWHAVSCVTVLQSFSTTVAHTAEKTTLGDTADATLGDAGSVFTGCLPSSSYSAADRVSFLGFLEENGCLLPHNGAGDACAMPSRDGGEVVPLGLGYKGDGAAFAVVTAEELTHLRHALKCPSSLTNELVVAHGIWARLGATLSQPQQ